MLVWGSKGEAIHLNAHEQKHCPACEKERTFRVLLQYKVSHIWYLFKWVSEKQYALVCDVCHRGEKLVSKAVEAQLGKPPIPFMSRWGWTFLAALIGVGVLLGAYDSAERKNRIDAFVSAPAKDDIYILNVSSLLDSPDSSSAYGLLRIKNIDGDQIEFDVPQVSYNKVSGANKDLRNGDFLDADYFHKDSVVLSSEDISDLQQAGAIHTIQRRSGIGPLQP